MDDILMRFPFPHAIYRWMRLHQMHEAVALGWIPLPPNDAMSHNADNYAVLCAWLCCDCGRPMRVPL
jgi:hypothetical protein